MTTLEKTDVVSIIKNLQAHNSTDLKVLAQHTLEHNLFDETVELIMLIQETTEIKNEFTTIASKVVQLLEEPAGSTNATKAAPSALTQTKRLSRSILPSAEDKASAEKFTNSLRALVEKVVDAGKVEKSKPENKVKAKAKVKVKAEPKSKKTIKQVQEKVAEQKAPEKVEVPVEEKKALTPKQLNDRKQYLKRRLAKVTGTPKELDVLKELAALS